MRIGGIDPKTLSTEVTLVLPRGEDQNIVFVARGLPDMEAFNALCPQPKPPGKQTRDGFVPMDNDPTYQQVLGEWAKKRLGYMVIHSLVPSGIEWDTVDPNNPKTWQNWEKDLRDSNLSDIEVNRVLALVMEANALDEAKLRKAREVFLAGQGKMPVDTSGQVSEPAST